MHRISIIVLTLCMPSIVAAVEYNCEVEKKFDSENTYTTDHINKLQFSVEVEEGNGGAFLSRCSYSSSAKKIT